MSFLADTRTIEAKPDPTAVPLTKASPSFGRNSKNPDSIPASRKASLALRVSPLGPTDLEFGRPSARVSLEQRVDPDQHGCCVG
ncbi:hypothetical protein SLEP1_g46440 [Rubroshorea leprosula]|uniref:Uncharacterized protein n=1 Tax=Rubroshorea leprosula TaxID=152421 RepID=A0AAV5LMU8_9ROSI|nr:hypothetical protein SLEP1_g46440 [Rubroshorea leprosula]